MLIFICFFLPLKPVMQFLRDAILTIWCDSNGETDIYQNQNRLILMHVCHAPWKTLRGSMNDVRRLLLVRLLDPQIHIEAHRQPQKMCNCKQVVDERRLMKFQWERFHSFNAPSQLFRSVLCIHFACQVLALLLPTIQLVLVASV